LVPRRASWSNTFRHGKYAEGIWIWERARGTYVPHLKHSMGAKNEGGARTGKGNSVFTIPEKRKTKQKGKHARVLGMGSGKLEADQGRGGGETKFGEKEAGNVGAKKPSNHPKGGFVGKMNQHILRKYKGGD